MCRRRSKHICEVQIIHGELLKLKADQTPVYNLVRSLGLVGPLPEATTETRRRPPQRTRAALAVLRIFMARHAAYVGWNYVVQGYGADMGLVAPGQVKIRMMKAPALVYAAAMAPPYLFCAFLLIRDLLAQFDSTCARFGAVAAIWFLQVILGMGETLYKHTNFLPRPAVVHEDVAIFVTYDQVRTCSRPAEEGRILQSRV